MKFRNLILEGVLTGCALVLGSPAARAQAQAFLIPAAERDCVPSVWFQALQAGQTGYNGHAGMVHLGVTNIDDPTLNGGYLSWTADGVYLTLFGGAITTQEVLGPGPNALPLTKVRGIVHLASAFEIHFDALGALTAVILHAGALAWDANHVYLITVGGGVATAEVLLGTASMPGVKGIVRLAGDIIDTNPSPAFVNTYLSAGAVEYTVSNAYLTTIGGSVTTQELLTPAPGSAPIDLVRGVLPMGGAAVTSLESAAFLWTPTRVFMLTTGGTVAIQEILDNNLPIADVWGIIRQSPQYNGNPPFKGAVSIITNAKEYLTLVGGAVVTTHVTQASGAPILSSVVVPGNNAWLHQSSLLMQVIGLWQPPTGGSVRGTVIGLEQ